MTVNKNKMKTKDIIATTLAKMATLMTLAAALVTPATLVAQGGFNIPYSQYGIGSDELCLPVAERMGGAILTRSASNYINPMNPASYAGIEKESFVFDMGLNLQANRLRQGDATSRAADGNIGYLSIGMPLTGWWKIAAGLMPYSTVDYLSTVAGSDRAETEYFGSGGVNRIFAGMAFNIPAGKTTRVQAGFNVNYLTGRIGRAISYTFAGNDTTYHINSRKDKTTTVSNVTFDFGVQAWQKMGQNLTLGIGLSYKPYMDMTASDEALIYTFAADETIVDTIFPSRGQATGFSSRLEQPRTVGVGLSLQVGKRWLVAADATFAAWSGMRYTEDPTHAIFGADAVSYGPTSRYALGVERLGNMDASTYWGRIGWSVGAHTALDVLQITVGGAEHRLDAWGVGAGISLPMRKGRSLLTLSLSYSSMGTPDVVRREALTVGIAVSSCERWFVKRKYN